MNLGSEVKFKLRHILSVAKDPLRGSSILPNPNWNIINPIFIISTGRTGTHFLTHFFNNNFENVKAFHEPDIDVYDLNMQYLRGDISDHRARMMFRDFRIRRFNELKTENIKNYIESNNNLSYLIPIIKKEFKNYKIIHIQRNGKETVRSMYSKETTGKWVGSVPLLSKDDPRNRLKATFFEDDPYFKKWNKLSRFQKICWLWAKKDSEIFKNTKNDDRTEVFKFRDLFIDKKKKTWERLFNFTKLKRHLIKDNFTSYISKERSNQPKNYKLPKWPEWTLTQKKQFIEIAGSHMEKAGYSI